ncbi:MAG: response regulator transcription factor [Lachnospiraceae bacterium]|nr:response regulator transcription factor [Lachnospiraceae bacterium]
MKTIAIIDDDIHIGNMLEELLQQEGYATLRAYSGTEALYLLSQKNPDLVLLDLMLPGLNGEDVLPHIKDLPVIVVSAKIDMDNKVNLLLNGACDYVTKPFDTGELLARIKIHLRPVRQNNSNLCAGDLTLDMNKHEVSVNNVPVKLTKTEYAILKLLIQNANQVISKNTILDRISMDTPDCTDSSLKQHISNLRKKLREVNGTDYIEAVWGIGFQLNI